MNVHEELYRIAKAREGRLDGSDEDVVIADTQDLIMGLRPVVDDPTDGYDWNEAFGVAMRDSCTEPGPTGGAAAPFGPDDVAQVLASREGENDGPNWLMLGRLKDGRYFFVEAGCDYTGWG